ncbi:ankyrin repeat-containing domain protein [Umbelopsis sp. AD052]|nr:ankyrin repeat-containing domain protein [Umbelopsis sp. AD052]
MEHFEAAYEFVNSLSNRVPINNDQKLSQGTIGDCNVKKPSLFEFRDRAKWDAWNSRRGLSLEEGKEQYVELVESMNIGWARQGQYEVELEDEGTQEKQGMGASVSAMAYDGDSEGEEVEDGFFFAREGDLNKLSEYIERAATSVDDRDAQGLTMLHYACDRGNIEAVKLLVTSGADVNALTEENETPLHFACLSEREEIAQYLIDQKCDLTVQDTEGNTAENNTSSAFWKQLRV